MSTILKINYKIEEEISELSKAEIKELGLKSQLDQLILACYNTLSLITFYTITGGKETRAWTLKKGSRAPEAGLKVHSDFEGFIKGLNKICLKYFVSIGPSSKAVKFNSACFGHLS